MSLGSNSRMEEVIHAWCCVPNRYTRDDLHTRNLKGGGGGEEEEELGRGAWARTSYLLALGCPLKPVVKSPNPPPFQYSPSLLQARGAYSMHFHTGPLIPRITKKIQYFGLFSK